MSCGTKRIAISRSATKKAQITGKITAPEADSAKGFVINITPAKPTSITSQRSGPTFSPSNGAASNARNMGDAKPSVDATAIGSIDRPVRNASVAHSSNRARSRFQRCSVWRLKTGWRRYFMTSAKIRQMMAPRKNMICPTLNTWVICLTMASLVVIIDIAMTTNSAAFRLLNSKILPSSPILRHPRESGDLVSIGSCFIQDSRWAA